MTVPQVLGYITSVLDIMGFTNLAVGFLIFIFVIAVIFSLGNRR